MGTPWGSRRSASAGACASASDFFWQCGEAPGLTSSVGDLRQVHEAVGAESLHAHKQPKGAHRVHSRVMDRVLRRGVGVRLRAPPLMPSPASEPQTHAPPQGPQGGPYPSPSNPSSLAPPLTNRPPYPPTSKLSPHQRHPHRPPPSPPPPNPLRAWPIPPPLPLPLPPPLP